MRAQAYDVVLNGVELGSGSMRIHQKDVQRKMFEALGFSEEQIQERFGFMVNAFQYGTPPHGGFASAWTSGHADAGGGIPAGCHRFSQK